MTFLQELEDLVQKGRISQPFTVEDVLMVTNNPEAKNLSNYYVGNAPTSNKNKKVLKRDINNDGKYEYYF